MKGKIAFVVIKIIESKNRKALILISFLFLQNTFKSFKKQRKKLFVVKISEVLCKRPETLFKITPVDVKYKVLATACK